MRNPDDQIHPDGRHRPAACLLAGDGANPYTDDSTYQGLGGKEGIKKIVDTFITLVLADPRIKDNFTDFDIPQLNVRLQEQFCEFAGGPCKYTGKYRDKTMDGVGTVARYEDRASGSEDHQRHVQCADRGFADRDGTAQCAQQRCVEAGRQAGADAARYRHPITARSRA
ncbi:group I truncated hemoglobin [Duganella sp. P38]|uniref:group I truncated hemoglobin n=1 Tax=Duganella sp. P38 TaxID=3423949 RepID=UPI003D7BCF0F